MLEVMALSLLALSVFAIYLQVGGHRPIPFDDSLYLTSNAWVLRGLTWEGMIWAFTNVDAANWHPITWISHMANQELFGSLIGGHMIENLFWHVGNSFLVYRLLMAFGVTRLLALGLGLVFACHPLNVESVAWLSQRKNQISTFMLLATFILYLDWRSTGRRITLVLLTAAYAISLMAKAMGVTLPAILLIYEGIVVLRADPAFFRQQSYRKWFVWARAVAGRISPLVAAAAAISVATFLAQRNSGAVATLDSIPLLNRVVNAFGALVTYLQTFFWPGELSLFYPIRLEPNWPKGLLGAWIVSLGSLWALLYWRRAPWMMFGWGWFLISLLPVIGLVQVGSQSHADRYMYVPMIGLLILLGSFFGTARLAGCRWPRGAFTALIFAFAVGMGAHAYAYTMTWHNAESAYRRSLALGGVSYTMLLNLASVLTNLNYLKSAEPYARLSAELWPDRPLALANYASLNALLGKHEEAERGYRRAIALEPDNVQHRYMLALVLIHADQVEAAEQALQEALDYLPSADDWSVGSQMIRRVLLREIPLENLRLPALIASDAPASDLNVNPASPAQSAAK